VPKREAEVQEPDLRTILFHGRWLILASVGFALLLAIVSIRLTDKTYEATALLSAHPSTSAVELGIEPAARPAQTYAEQMVDRGFLDQISRRVRPLNGHRRSSGELRAALSAEVLGSSELVRLHADGPTPGDARDLANDVANAFVIYARQATEQRAAQLHDELHARATALDRRLRKHRDPNLVAQRDALTVQDSKLTVAAVQQSLSVNVLSPATPAPDPIRPRPLLNLLAGLVLGLVVGLGLAWLRSALQPAAVRADEHEPLLARQVP